MPYEIYVYPEKRLVGVGATGAVTDDDLLGIDNRMRNDPNITPDFNQLVDASEASGVDFSSKEVQKITSREAFFSTASRRAIVAPSDIGFGMACMFELYRGDDGARSGFFGLALKHLLGSVSHWSDRERVLFGKIAIIQ